MGVAIVSDIFMEAIERVTSKKKRKRAAPEAFRRALRCRLVGLPRLGLPRLKKGF